MKFSLKIYMTLIAILMTCSVFGQQVVLSGVVTDKEFGDPLSGANVYIVNQSNRALGGVMANVNGEYHIRIPDQAGLRVVFSFIGFVTQTIEYKGQEKLDVQLSEMSQTLKSVEVVAQRVERSSMGLSRKQIVAATQKVTLENIETAPVANVADALQGALANVDILTGADPGSKTTIRIRGTSSLNASSEPLIVLDGVPFPAEIDDFDFATADSDDYGALLNISPQDIESIETLKDAAATAIWGSRGANGVLLITTKKGVKGKINFSFSTKGEFRKEGSTIPLLNGKQYCSMIQDAIWNTVNDLGTGSSTTTNYLSMIFNEPQINFNDGYVYFKEYNQNTNWVDEVTQHGFSIDNSFSMSGGGDKATYRFSVGYLSDEGTTIGTAYNRFSTTFNLKYHFSDKLDISTDFRFNRGDRDLNWDMNNIPTPRNMAIKKMPNESPYVINPDGSRSGEYFTLYENFQGTWANNRYYNPVAMVNEAKNRTLNYDNMLTVNLHYKFFDGLDYRGYVSLKANTADKESYLPSCVTGVPYTDSWYNQSYERSQDSRYLATENKVTYMNIKNLDHQIIATAALTTQDNKVSVQELRRTGVASSSLDDVTIGLPSGMSSAISQSRNVGVIANANYTFLGKYLINAGYRLEGNSSVGRDERWGNFYTFGGAWHFAEESFLGLGEKAPWLSTGKLRYAWGQSGNSPSGIKYIGTFESIGTNYIEMTPVQPSSIQLNNLKWETVTSNNLGIELGFINDQFTLGFELYDKVTTDLLQKDYKVPSSVGYNSYAYYNSGKMTNKGWELMMGMNKKIGKDWRVTMNFNIAQNFNTVNELPDNKLEESYSFKNGSYASKVVTGDPLGSFYGYKYQGVYQTVEETYARDAKGNIMYNMKGEPVIMTNGNQKVYPGDAKYADVNNDGKIDKYDIVYLGNAMPTLTGGMQLGVNYKTWGLNVNLQGRAGQKVINGVRMNMESMYGKENQSTAVLRRWRNEGDDTEITRALYNRGYNYLGSDRFVEDASFLRVKSITLKYSLPKRITEAWRLNLVQLYVTGYDLYTFTNYKGQDPEVNIKGTPYVLATDGANTPKPIRIAFGVNLKF